MPDDRPHFLERPLWGKPRQQPPRETDPDRIRLSRLRGDRYCRNGAQFMAPACLAFTLQIPLFMALVAAPLLPGAGLRSNLEEPTVVNLLKIIGEYVAAAIVGTAVIVMLPALSRRLTRTGWPPVLMIDDERMAKSERNARRVLQAIGLLYALCIVLVAITSASLFSVGFHATVIGAALLSAGLRWSTGDDIVCARCAYAHTPELPVCPECGSDWTNWWNLRMGRPVRRRWLVCLGLALLVGGIAALITITQLNA